MRGSLQNPFWPGAETPSPELAGHDELRETTRIALERTRRALPTKSVLLLVGLRGAGKTVLLDRMRGCRSIRAETVRAEAAEKRSLPALVAPQLRVALLRPSCHEQAKDLVTRALRGLAGFAQQESV